MSYTQSDSPVAVSCSLGSDTFLMVSLHWQERLGRPFEAELSLLSENGSIDIHSMIKQPMSIQIEGKNDTPHWLHGYVNRFESFGPLGDLWSYRARLTPSIGLMRHSGGCRIFQDFTTVDVIKKIFSEHGFSGQLEERLSQTYNPRTYCVQYGESDFQLLHRLMEEEGIYYFFEYSENQHLLVLADDMSAHKTIEGYASIPYRGAIYPGIEDHLTDFSALSEFGTGTVVLTDYDFEKPKSPLLVQQNSPQRKSDYEWFDYPGGYTLQDDGQRLARIRMEAEDAARSGAWIRGNCRAVRCGNIFGLTDHPIESLNIDYLITETILLVEAPPVQAGEAGEFKVNLNLRCQTTKSPFRLLPETPKPRIYGPHVATVTGKTGEEIWTDPYGRIKVKFPWDRSDKVDEGSSCWLRVSQGATGKNWGSMSLPRIGDEVIVEFIDGNPDRPIVTGRVFNAERMPPEELATSQAKTVFRTRSTKGADATAFHELTFDDTKDKENILFQSERDFQRIVENNDSLKVGFEKKSPGDRIVEIYNNQTVTIGKGSGAGSYDLTVQKDFHTKVNDGSVTVEAAKSILLKCGDSQIEITPSGIQIKCPSFTLKADGAVQAAGSTVTVKADTTLDLEGGSASNLKASGNVVIKGALVQIN